MSDFNKVNNIAGWIVFALATLVYTITIEPTASFWDVGEFIASAYKLEVPHPPGAPFFLLMGRMFSFLSFGDVTQVAFWINMISVLASGFTILFLFWSISLLGRKILKIEGDEISQTQTYLLIASGAVGAFAYTFSDSFWFSAVEAEVYATSSFFTAFVFWAILKWERMEDQSRANRWLILIAYMMGLSIGVHLLNLVTIPALGMIYYYKKYSVSTIGFVLTMVVSGLIIMAIMVGVIPGLPSIAGKFEVIFVNSFGLPFGSGILTFILLLLAAMIFGVWYTQKKGKPIFNTIMLGLTFVLVGYSSYAIIPIRSDYDPPIDQNNPEDIMNIVSYLKREQYGYRPLVHGQYFTAQLQSTEKGGAVYARRGDKYEAVQFKTIAKYDPQQTTIMPRIYSTDGNHVKKYREVLGLKEGEVPNFIDNVRFLFKHQLGHMYMRYFMWNFAGRSSDIQNADWLRPWESGADLPDVIAQNNARNNYLMLPLIFGLFGMFFHYKKHRKGFWVVAMLFFLTGIALILYLNSPPIEPRERDYIYVGSFYAFAMWIGLAVMALYDAAKSLKWEELGKLAVYPFGAGIVIYLFELMFGGGSGGSFSIIYMSVVWAGLMALMILARTLIQRDKALIALATILCLIVPGIMMAQGWNDHDRSDRYFSVDSAKNYLASCAPNAILFTGGDNDTFPLWYVQEVEGFRTDVRVIVLTYFATDWYNEQMRRSTYGSAPLPFTLNSHDYRQGGPNDYLPVTDDPRIKGQAIDLKQYLQLVTDESKAIQYPTQDDYVNLIPARKMFLKVDTSKIISDGLLSENLRPYLTDRLLIDIKGNAIYKNDLGILDIIATNQWERPIYFNQTSLINTKLRLDPYVVQEGATYRLLPVFNSDPMRRSLVNTEVMYDNMMNKFHWRELDNPDVYYNTEDYLDKAISVHRSYFNTLSRALLDEGKTDQAKEVLLKSLELIPDEVVAIRPYSAQLIQMLIEVGEVDRGTELANNLATRIDRYLTYLEAQGINDTRQSYLNFTALRVIDQALTEAGKTEDAEKVKALMTKYVPSVQP